MSSPVVSVVMPTWNQADFIQAALASVYAQTFKDYELIVVDDCSTDGTQKILEAELAAGRIKKHVRHEQNKRSAAAINTGIDMAEGQYWTWISSDNTMHAVWLERLVNVMLMGSGAAYSGFNYVPCTGIRPSGKVRYLYVSHEKDKLVNQKDCYYGPSFLIKDDVWREAGPHRGAISHDYDHWLRVEEVCYRQGLPIVGLDVALCDYLAHGYRATVTRKIEFDAGFWQAEGRRRRNTPHP